VALCQYSRVHSLDEATAETPSPADEVGPARWDRYDAAIVAAAAVATLCVHPVGAMLHHPYWLDEAWVADLTRVPLARVAGFSSVTPVGFVTLLKLVPGGGLQRGRLVVLTFAAASTAMAYVLVRGCHWPSMARARFAATVAALATMLAPFSLARNDLKQYTCDAFCALLILTITARVDRRSEPAPTWWLAAVSVATIPFSSTASFVAVAAFAGLLGSALWTRSRRRIVEVVVVGAVTGVILVAYFAAFVLPNDNAAVRDYWNDFYLRGAPWTMLHDGWTRLSGLHLWLGMPAIAFAFFFVAGVVGLARLGARGPAIAIPFLWLEMIVLARVRRYPFLDRRTSHFLLVLSMAVVAIGAVGLIDAVFRWKRVTGVVVGIGLSAGFVAGFATHVDVLEISNEDSRSLTTYVAEHRTPRDVILVSAGAAFGFSFYWPHGRLVAVSADTAEGFRTGVAGLHAVYADGSTNEDVLSALRVADARRRAAGPGSRLFVVASHVLAPELRAWNRAFAQLDLHPRTVSVGPEPLLIVDTVSG
jgi:hypothetical protein